MGDLVFIFAATAATISVSGIIIILIGIAAHKIEV